MSWAVRESFRKELSDLGNRLNESQRTAIALQRSWSRLRPEDCDNDVEVWWDRLLASPRESLNSHQRAVVDAFMRQRRGATRLSRHYAPGSFDITRACIGSAPPSFAANAWTGGSRWAGGFMWSSNTAAANAAVLSRRTKCCQAGTGLCSAKRFVPPTRLSGSLGRIAMQRKTSRTSCQWRPTTCPTPVGT